MKHKKITKGAKNGEKDEKKKKNNNKIKLHQNVQNKKKREFSHETT